MSTRQNNNHISTDTIDHTSHGNDNLNFLASKVDVGRDINHISYQYNLNFGGVGSPLWISGETIQPLPGHPAESRGAPLAARPLDDSWCSEIVEVIGDSVELKNIAPPITAVYSRELEGQKRVYLQLDKCPSTILEFKPQRPGHDWVIANWIDVPDAAAPATRLASVCLPGGTEMHLFYISSQHHIKHMVWNPQDGWQHGTLFGDKSPTISRWSSLSALLSANCIKLFYQRDDKICELSYGLGNRSWDYKELKFFADRGTPISSTSYAGANSTVYHVYFQKEGATYEWKTDHEGFEVEELGMEDLGPFPPPCSSLAGLAAISGFTSNLPASIRIYYGTEGGGICECRWDNKLKWQWNNLTGVEGTLPEGGQIAALQNEDGSRIRLYYLSKEPHPDGITVTFKLKQVAFSRTIKTPKVKSICSRVA